MEFGGNARALEFFRANGVRTKLDYSSSLAAQYREILKASVLKAVENRMECMSCNPANITVAEIASSSVDSMETFRSDEPLVLPQPTHVQVSLPPPQQVSVPPQVPIQGTTSGGRVLINRPKAQVIDDFDFDSVPTVPVPVRPQIILSNRSSPLMSPALVPRAQYGGIIDQPPTTYAEAHPPLSSRGSSIDDFKEKSKELVQKGFQAGKDWYAQYMHK